MSEKVSLRRRTNDYFKIDIPKLMNLRLTEKAEKENKREVQRTLEKDDNRYFLRNSMICD